MRSQLHLDHPGPLLVGRKQFGLVCNLVDLLDLGDAGEHEITEALAFAVEGPDMPSQSIVGKSARNDLAAR